MGSGQIGYVWTGMLPTSIFELHVTVCKFSRCMECLQWTTTFTNMCRIQPKHGANAMHLTFSISNVKNGLELM